MIYLNFVFSSFVIISPLGAASQYISYSNRNIGMNSIEYGEYEVEWYYNWFVGRHVMASIDSAEDLGYMCIDVLSQTYNGYVLENFEFTDTVTTVLTTTVSTTVSLSSSITTSLAGKVGINGISVSNNMQIGIAYNIQSTITYSYSLSTTLQIFYTPAEEYVRNKHFFLCTGARVYKIYCQTWMYDNYWWGDYEVSGSRESFVTYLTVDPLITIGYTDGTIIYEEQNI